MGAGAWDTRGRDSEARHDGEEVPGVHAAVGGGRPHPFTAEALEGLGAVRVDGVVDEAGDHTEQPIDERCMRCHTGRARRRVSG